MKRLPLLPGWEACQRCPRHEHRLGVVAPVWKTPPLVLLLAARVGRASQAVALHEPALEALALQLAGRLGLQEGQVAVDYLLACGLGAGTNPGDVAACSERLYWSVSHSVHHSSPRYDATTSLRVSFVDGYTSPWFQVPAVLVGFHPLLVFGCFGVIIAYQTWIHTETVGRLGWLDRVLNTPSNHRVHHSSLPEHLDKNYGGILIVWDRLFGTYAAETEPVTYGLTTPVASTHPVDVHLYEARRLLGDLREAHPSERLSVLFRGPEYEPRPRDHARGTAVGSRRAT